ncbi:hypothetical protein ACOME3_002595 [Neoechinorhynchus agilis]
MTFGLLELFVIGFTFVSAKWAPFHMPGFIPIKSTWDLYYQLRTAEIVGKFAPKEIDCALLESQLESIDSDHERFYLIEQFKSLSKCEIKLDQEANDDLLRTATTSEEVFYALSLNNYEMNDAKDAVMQKPLESVDQISFTLLSLTYIKAYSELDRVFKKADDWFERTYDLDDLTVLRFFDSYIEAAKHVSSGYLSDSRTRMIVDRILQIPTESQELLFLQLRILSELNEGNISKVSCDL